MMKEMNHCKQIEDLICVDRFEHIKLKAKDYVKKYMAKYVPVYKPSEFDS